MSVAVIGAGAFGTALAIALARDGRGVVLWGRDAAAMHDMASAGENRARLPGHKLPDTLAVTASLDRALEAEVILLAVPMQILAPFLDTHKGRFAGRRLVAACKGIDLASGRLAHEIIADAGALPALLSGPGFAADIAAGLPTALTLAADDPTAAAHLQSVLSCEALRLYRSDDTAGVALGGALKNVIALATGMAMGAGLGESARAALMTRGYAEMLRYALTRGARPETLAGLSGFGDLVLTCTSTKSRNYTHGLALGAGKEPGAATVEGVATARAVAGLSHASGTDMPIARSVAAILDGASTVAQAMDALLSRPLKKE